MTTAQKSYRITIDLTTTEVPDWIADCIDHNIDPTESYSLNITQTHAPTPPPLTNS